MAEAFKSNDEKMSMQKMRFSLDISAPKYQSYYMGAAKFVKVRSDDGRTLRFPASALQKFVNHSGIQGRFEIVFNDQCKLVSISRVG